MALFITLEGGDAVGKGTQLQLLKQRFDTLGQSVITLRDPGGTPVGEAIRNIFKGQWDQPPTSLASFFLICACKHQMVNEAVKPMLSRGVHVLCDRFIDSTYAYQLHGDQLGHDKFIRNELWQIVHRAIDNVWPDLTFVIDLPYEVMVKRIKSRGEPIDRWEAKGKDFFERTRAGFSDAHNRWGGRVKLINGDQSIEDVSDQIWQHVSVKLITHHRQPAVPRL